jgi:hypothetical protein
MSKKYPDSKKIFSIFQFLEFISIKIHPLQMKKLTELDCGEILALSEQRKSIGEIEKETRISDSWRCNKTIWEKRVNGKEY